MTINVESIQKLMKLAKINASAEVQQKTATQISEIMSIISEIKDVSINTLPPSQDSQSHLDLRVDKADTAIDVERYQKNCQFVANQYYTVPKVID